MLLRFLLVKTQSVDGIPGSLAQWTKQLHVSKKDINSKKKNFGKSFSKMFEKDGLTKEQKDKEEQSKKRVETKLLK